MERLAVGEYYLAFPLVSIPVRGRGYGKAFRNKIKRHSKFPSPLGEEVMESLHPNGMTTCYIEFPSPLGEEVMERITLKRVFRLSGFHPR